MLEVIDDFHAMWRTIGLQYQLMREQAPYGHEPVVQVQLLGSAAAIPVSRIETHRGQGLVLLHVITAGTNTSEPHPSDRLIYVAHDRIGHAEISFQRIGPRPSEFSVGEAKDEAPVGV